MNSFLQFSMRLKKIVPTMLDNLTWLVDSEKISLYDKRVLEEDLNES
jgi:hypothetical protein